MRKSVIILIILTGLFTLGYYLYVVLSKKQASTTNRAIEENKSVANMFLTSPLFKNNELIPAKFTCDGGDINPELQIQNVPEGAKSLVLVMDDPDAPGRTFTHWLVWNIDPKTSIIKEESVPPGSVEGKTDFGRTDYGGPCPPPGRPHRYFFKLYALNSRLNLAEGSTKPALETEIKSRIIDEAELIGLYGRQ